VLYHDLRLLARAKLRRSAPMTVLDTTALVHESYLRFLRTGDLKVEDRPHFLAYAARVMRSIVVDLIRSRLADRHGGDALHVTLHTEIAESASVREDEVILVNDALEELATIDPRLVKVVEMRYFAGMSEDEIAESLGVSVRTVERDWEKARLFLYRALK
jgi:RNA polymerase sigma factor (TIGR02999 family)